jgi:hypothetical protein
MCGVEQNKENSNMHKQRKYILFNSRCKECAKIEWRNRNKKKVENLPDNYVEKKLKEAGFENINKTLIDSKRLIIQIKREINASKKQ